MRAQRPLHDGHLAEAARRGVISAAAQWRRSRESARAPTDPADEPLANWD